MSCCIAAARGHSGDTFQKALFRTSINWFYWDFNNTSTPANISDLDSPDRFVQWVVELKTEAVFLRGSLNQLAGIKQDGANPVVRFGSLIDEKHSWLQGTPQLSPTL